MSSQGHVNATFVGDSGKQLVFLSSKKKMTAEFV